MKKSSPRKPLPQAEARRDGLVALALTLFSILVYGEIYFWRAFGPEFPLYYFYGDGATWRSVLNTYVDFSQGWYRPTGSLPYWLVQKVVDWHDLAAWRLANVLTCAATAWLVYILALEMFPKRRMAAVIGAVFFLVHPDFYVSTFEVATFDFLHLIFALLTILFYLRSLRPNGRPAWALASWVCFVIAVTAKEVNIALPGVLFVASALNVWKTPAGDRRGAASRELMRLAPFAAVLPAYWYYHICNMPKPDAASPYHLDFDPGRTVTMFVHLVLWGMRVFFVMGLKSPDVYPANWLDHVLGLASVGVVLWQWRKLLQEKPEFRFPLILLCAWYVILLLIPAATAGFMRHTSLSVPAYSIVFGIAFAHLLQSFPEQKRRLAVRGGVAVIFVYTLAGIHTELHAGTHSLPIRISETLLDKPPVPPQNLGNSPTVYIEDRLNLGPWAYGCFGRLFNFVYKRKDITEVIVKPGDPSVLEAIAGSRNTHVFRYNDNYEWYDATEEVRAQVLQPSFAEIEPGRAVRFETRLRNYAKLKWKVMPAGLGGITADGVYTAPALLRTPASVEISATTEEQNPRTVKSLVNLFPRWQDAVIGNPGSRGSHTVAGHSHVIEGAGDLWGQSDQFHFIYQRISGDGSWIAQVSPQDPNGQPAKAGVMIRSSLSANAPNLFAGVFSGVQSIVCSRRAAGANTVARFGPFAFTYFKIQRRGNELTGYTSPDGQNWMDLGGPVSIPLGSEPLAGLVVTSGNGPTISAAFSNVRWEGIPNQ